MAPSVQLMWLRRVSATDMSQHRRLIPPVAALAEMSAYELQAYITPEHVRKYRTLYRLSQTTLARLVGVCYATVSRWENGTTVPSETMSRKLWDVFLKLKGSHDAGAKD